jgi:hypothetical protein
MTPIADPAPAPSLRAEVASLPAVSVLVQEGELRVLAFCAPQAPVLLREIGRCREQTFRAEGEGTGEAVDLDLFDESYLQLVLWDEARGAVAGGYRLGFVQPLLQQGGERALYTSGSFLLAPPLLERLVPALELGRSFVVHDYQRSFAPLLLLWRGIGAVLAQRPELHLLVGALSVSARYSLQSRREIAAFLLADERRSAWAPLVSARQPFLPETEPPGELRELEARVLQREGRRPPVLVRQYLQLGMRALCCATDPSFGGCLDLLCIADLRETPLPLLRRYMGEQESLAFLRRHGAAREAA